MQTDSRHTESVRSKATAGPDIICGVYYLTDGLDVLYVGASRNIWQRLRGWRSKDIDFSQVFVDRCKPEELEQLEREAIRRYDSPFNLRDRR